MTVYEADATVAGEGIAYNIEAGDNGEVTAWLNGGVMYGPEPIAFSRAYTAVPLQTGQEEVTLVPGENVFELAGSITGCSLTDSKTVYYQTHYLDTGEEEGPAASECEGNPCDPATGGKREAEVDVDLPHGLRFVRYYDSRTDYRYSGSVGRHWRHNFHSRINGEGPSAEQNLPQENAHAAGRSANHGSASDACTSGWAEIQAHAFHGLYHGGTPSYANNRCTITLGEQTITLPVHSNDRSHLDNGLDPSAEQHVVRRPDGARYTFHKTPDGSWQHLHGLPVALEHQANGMGNGDDEWRFTAPDGTVERYDRWGRMVATTPVGGYALTLRYDDEDRIETITGPFGRTLTLRYDTTHDRLHQLTTPDGVITYDYDDANDEPYRLIQVTDPDTSTRHYHYEAPNFPDHLTGISDENGVRYATWDYDELSGKVIASEHAGGAGRVEFAYSGGTTNVTAWVQADDPATPEDESVTNTRSYHFEVKGGATKVSEITGDRCITCPKGQQKIRTYHDDGQLASVTDWNGNLTQYDYITSGKNLGRLKSVSEAPDNTTIYRTVTTWDNEYPLPATETLLEISVDDPDNATVRRILHYSYYPKSAGYPSARLHTLTRCDPGTNGQCSPNDPQRTTTFSYYGEGEAGGQNGQLQQVDGPLTVENHTQPGNVPFVDDITTYAYDSQGNLTRITNALGHTTELPSADYDAAGRPQRLIDPNGVITELRYDLRGRLTRYRRQTGGDSTSPVFDETVFGYQDNGLLASLTQPDNATITYEYDDARRLIAILDGDGSRIDYERDLLGNRLFEIVSETIDATTQTNRAISGWSYDPLGQLEAIHTYKSLTAPADEIVVYAHDANGNRITETLSNTHTHQYFYDGLNRLSAHADPLQESTVYRQDLFNNTQSVTTPRGTNQAIEGDFTDFTTTYHYNALGELLTETSPDRGQMSYQYDSAGNRKQKSFDRSVPGSAVVHYRYDALNRLTAIDYADPTVADIAFHYDEPDRAYGIGRLTSMADETGHTAYDYDILGRLHIRTHTATDNTVTRIEYGYDAADRIRSITYPTGHQAIYHRDPLGQVTRVTLEKENESWTLIEQIDYQPFGPVRSWTHGNGIAASAGHDASYRLSTLDVPGILTRHYAYDAFGNIEQITDNATAPQTQTFQYDPLSRLEDAQGNYGHQAFAYDENGNRETFTQDGIPESLTYDSLSDQLEVKGAQSRSYDLAGNTLTRGNDTFTYDDRNRLVSVTVDGTTTSYQYNGIGERTQKSTNGESRHYLYGKDGKLLMERDGDHLRLRYYVYLDDRPIAVFDVERQLADTPPAGCGGATVDLTDLTVGTAETLACTASTELTTGNGAQETGFTVSAGGQALLQAPVVRLLPNTHIKAGAELHISPTSVEDFESQDLFSSANIYYLHTDHLNTTRAITDSGQSVVWRWDSDPFGTSTPTSNGFVFNQRFPGQYYDEESGLHYNYFRDYDPSTGRYVQSDPIGLEGGINSYLYAFANPKIYFDPTGELVPAVVVGGRLAYSVYKGYKSYRKAKRTYDRWKRYRDYKDRKGWGSPGDRPPALIIVPAKTV